MIVLNPVCEPGFNFRCEVFGERFCTTICKNNIEDIVYELLPRLMMIDDDGDQVEVDCIFIDITGWGAVLYDMLQRRGLHMFPIAAKAIDLWLPKNPIQ